MAIWTPMKGIAPASGMAEKKGIKLGIKLTPEQRQMVIDALEDMWNAIADDCFVDDYGRHDGRKQLKGTEVRDIVGDRFYGGGDWFDEAHMREASDLYTKLSYSARRKILKEAFPDKIYCY